MDTDVNEFAVNPRGVPSDAMVDTDGDARDEPSQSLSVFDDIDLMRAHPAPQSMAG
jgi:hypothetical protein